MSSLPLSTQDIDCKPSLSMVLRESVAEVFRKSPYLALRAIQVEITGELLILTGRVPSYYLKQIAQTGVRQICALHRVINEIEVQMNTEAE